MLVSLLGYPLYGFAYVATNAGWGHRLRAWWRRGAAADDQDKGTILLSDFDLNQRKERVREASEFAPPSGGLCCRGARAMEVIESTRFALEERHSVAQFPARHYAWSGLVHSDYKPEFFYFRLLFYASITMLAFANTFLNPVFFLDVDTLGPSAGAIVVVTQVRPSCTFALAAEAARAQPSSQSIACYVPCARSLHLPLPSLNTASPFDRLPPPPPSLPPSLPPSRSLLTRL